jgi:hypothetical protein
MHAIILAVGTGLLWAFGFRDVVHEHLPWEASLSISAVVVFSVMFCLVTIFWTPAIMDGELRRKMKKRMISSRTLRANLSQKIVDLSRPPNNPKLENFRNTLNGLEPWMVELLKALAFKGPMNEPMALAHFGTSGIAPVHLHLLSILDGKTAWLNRDPYGKFTISEKVEKELIEIFQSQAR